MAIDAVDSQPGVGAHFGSAVMPEQSLLGCALLTPSQGRRQEKAS